MLFFVKGIDVCEQQAVMFIYTLINFVKNCCYICLPCLKLLEDICKGLHEWRITYTV